MTSTGVEAPPVRYEFLDALRGLAILAVIAEHCTKAVNQPFPLVRYGWAGSSGVQLFFVISAVTIFLTLERATGREKQVFKNFYVRRFFRILPMFWVGMLLYAFVPGREIYEQKITIGFLDYFLTVILQQGWHPFSLNSVVPGGWSIAVEATFYLMAPLLFLLLRNWQRALVFLFVSLLGCSALDQALSYLSNHHVMYDGVQAELMEFFHKRWFPSQLPVFAAGMLAYRAWQGLPAAFATRLNGLLLVVASGFILNATVGSDGMTLIPEPACYGLGFALLVVGLAIQPLALLVNGATQLMGRISYSVYLLHFAMLVAAGQVVERLPLHGGLMIFAAYFVLTLALTVPAAYVTARYVEKPFIRLGARLIQWMEQGKQAVPAPTNEEIVPLKGS
ncbi:acyltransferase [soil metagenome]